MKTIEDIIAENRSTVDQIDLPSGHRERMQVRLCQAAAKKRHYRRVLWVSSASAAAAVMAFFLWILPINNSADIPTPILTADQVEAIEVERYYRAQRDRAIDEVCAILEQKQSDAAVQISYGIAELKLKFEAEPLSRNLFANDTKKYIALTIARYTAQTEVVEELKKTVTNI